MNTASILMAVVLGIISLACDGVVRSQPQRPIGATGANRKTTTKPKPKPKPTPRQISPSSLTVIAEAGALIMIMFMRDAQAPQEETEQGKTLPSQLSPEPKTIPEGQNAVRFDNLLPGRYHVRAELEGYQPEEREISLAASKDIELRLTMRPRTYNVVIKTNADGGEVRYRTQNKAERVSPLIQGRASLDELLAGRYELEIRPEGAIWRPQRGQIEVGPGRQTEFSFELKREVCEDPFDATWSSLATWESAPVGWSVASLKLVVNGPGIALPRDEHFHCFADFELESDVRLLNGVAVSFVLRAKGRQNYYLIQLTGPKSDEPYVLRGFTVKNGVRQQLGNPQPLQHVAESLTGGFFEVKIKANGNRFEVYLRDQNGEAKPLGALIDRDQSFAIGAAGIAAQGDEQFEIGRFIVMPVKN